MIKRTWRVTWETSVEAATAEDAARKAREEMTARGLPHTKFTCFIGGGVPMRVDLKESDQRRNGRRVEYDHDAGVYLWGLTHVGGWTIMGKVNTEATAWAEAEAFTREPRFLAVIIDATDANTCVGQYPWTLEGHAEAREAIRAWCARDHNVSGYIREVNAPDREPEAAPQGGQLDAMTVQSEGEVG